MQQRTTRRRAARYGAAVVETIGGFSIREVRPGYYFVRARRHGKKLAQGFPSLEAARAQCNAWAISLRNEGLSALNLTQEQRTEAHKAITLLNNRATLIDVANYWLSHHPDHGSMTLEELCGKYLEDSQRRNVRPITANERRQRLARLCHDLGKRPAAGILTKDLQTWLDKRGGGPINRGNFRRCFTGLFNFATEHGLLTSNPATRLPVPEVTEKTPVFWTAAQVEALMRTAEAEKPELVPVLAVMAFAGLRPSEAQLLRWENVNLSERLIRVLPETSKNKVSRHAEVTPNLIRWLKPHQQKHGPLAPKLQTVRRWRERLVAMMVVRDWRERLFAGRAMSGPQATAAGASWAAIIATARKLRPELWPADVLRHSYASHRMAVSPDIGALADKMGNSPAIIRRHYRALVTPREGRKYFRIMPEAKQPAKVIAWAAA